MKKRIPVVLETDRKDYDMAVENMISEGGPTHLMMVEEEAEEKERNQEEPLH